MLSTAIGIVDQDEKILHSTTARLGYSFKFKSFPTTAQMVQSWREGSLGGVVTSGVNTSSPSISVGKSVVLALDSDIREGSWGGRICAASPEQRDVLAEMIGTEQPADLRLLTQRQYLDDQGCVDVYVTAVSQPSVFLADLPRPVYLKNCWAGHKNTVSFPAQQYATTYNSRPVPAPELPMVLTMS